MKFLSVGCLLLILFSCSQQKKKVKSYPIQNEKSGIKFSHFEQIFKAKEQVFQWNTNKDTLLTFEKGTKMFLPKSSVALKEKNKPVQVKVKECYEISDFIAEKLTTISNKGILETGGMVHVDIEQNGKDLKLKKGAEYTLYFPKDKSSKKEMKVFYADQNNGNSIKWIEGENSKSDKAKESDIEPSLVSSIQLNKIDTTRCRIVSGKRLTMINGEEVVWRFKNSNDLLIDYVNNNFKPSIEMINDFCDNKYQTEYNLTVDANGKIVEYKVNVGSKFKYDSLFFEFLKSCPELDMKFMPKKYKGPLSFGIQSNHFYDFDNGKFAKSFKEKNSNFLNQAITKVDKEDLNYFVISASKLGWINCDRFWETKDVKIDFIVSSSEDLNLNLVFEDIKSIMPAIKKGNSYIFENVPINRKVKILGIKFGKEKVQLAINKTVISRNAFAIKNFKDFTLTELEKELNGN